MAHRILIAGESGNHCLEMAYFDAFTELGHEVRLFDTKTAVMKYVRPNKLAYTLHRFLPVDAWIKKANKDLTGVAREFRPDIILAFTSAEVLAGTFAFLKSILPSRICWYWADPLPNLNRYIRESLPLTDKLFSYSEASLKVFRMMGAADAGWLPFAGDLSAHYRKALEQGTYKWDLSFIGSWRPEREKALQALHQGFPDLRLKVNGPYWNRCSYQPIKKIAVSKPLYGKDFSEVVSQSFLNLNVMDDTNYPASNMRFFEILTAGGTELCTACPEMEGIFRQREHVLYFSDERQLLDQVQFAMENKQEIEKIKLCGQDLLMQGHLYKHRAQAILNMI